MPYVNSLRQAFSASTWRAAWYLLAYQLVGWALLAAAATAASTAAVFAITLAGLPLLVTATGVIRACAERRRLRAVLCEPVEGRYREVAGIRGDGVGQVPLDGPCDLARRGLPGGHVHPAGGGGVGRARRLAHPGGRRHAAAVVLGAVRALPARRDRARSAARLLPDRPVRPRRGRPLRRHVAEGDAHRGRLPGPVRSVQLRPGATFGTDAQMRSAARRVAAALAAAPNSAADIRSPLGPGGHSLVSAGGRSALVTFQVRGNPDHATQGGPARAACGGRDPGTLPAPGRRGGW